MPELGAGKLIAERRGMRAWRRSIMQALASRAVGEAPNVAALQPGAETLLDALTSVASAMPRSDALAGIMFDVVEYERAHPDVEAVRQFLGVTDVWIDDLFRQAAGIK
ncbi:MAG: hypothetical protein RQ750_12240 [Roseovarius sp.]|nr:hypothetical protein [Roseovarius sp.]